MLQKKTKGEEVLEKVFQHLNVLEKDFFGLRYIDRNSQSVWHVIFNEFFFHKLNSLNSLGQVIYNISVLWIDHHHHHYFNSQDLNSAATIF